MHITLEGMASYARKTIGNIPEPMVGPSTTLITIPHPTEPDKTKTHIWMFGGRCVRTRRVSSGLWCLDMETLTWERIGADGPESEESRFWPRARYFHTADRWDTKLVIFGGMGLSAPIDASSSNGGTTPTGSIESNLTIDENPCVLNGVWIFDCVSRQWSRPQNANVGIDVEGGTFEPVLNTPAPRYAHTSVISRGNLVISGGQDLQNEYIMDSAILDLNTMRWQASHPLADHRGSYRSVSVASRYVLDEQALSQKDDYGNNLEQLPYSSKAAGGGSDIYTFSNSNFTDVRRQLQVSRFDPQSYDLQTTDITSQVIARSHPLPPGLRFPFASIIGHHLVIAGIYLSKHEQDYTVWALDMRTAKWTKIEAMVLSGSGGGAGNGIDPEALGGGSWNKAVTWEEASQLMVFGNKHKSLAEDYEQRAINFDHVAMIDLAIFGIYQPPVRDAITVPRMVPFALKSLRESWSSDFFIVCEDGRSLPCSKIVLEQRWPWFRENWGQVCVRARAVIDDMAFTSSPGEDAFGTVTPASEKTDPLDNIANASYYKWKSEFKIQPRSLHLSEPYPVCKALLEYLYTHSLVTPLQHRAPILSALLLLARQYKLEDLKEKVVYTMHERLDEANCLGIYEIASLCGCTSLQVRALRIVLTMQKRQSRGNTHRRDHSGTGLTPASAKNSANPATTPNGFHLTSTNGYHTSNQSYSRVPPNGQVNGYAMNLPPSSFRTTKLGHKRNSSSMGSLKSSPVPVNSEAIFTFPPRSDDSASIVSGSQASSSRLRSAVSHPALDSRHLNAPHIRQRVDSLGDFGMGSPSTCNSNSSFGEVLERDSEYVPPSFRARPRTASLKSVHHERQGSSIFGDNESRLSFSTKSRTRSQTFSQESKQRTVPKSKSISSFFSMPSAATSMQWIGDHLNNSSVAGTRDESENSCSRGITVTVGNETASLDTMPMPVTPGSAPLSARTDGSSNNGEGFDRGQSGGTIMPNLRHQRLCSVGGESDVQKTPTAKRPLRVDTRLAQSGFDPARPKRDSLSSARSSPRAEMPLFYIPPTRSRTGSISAHPLEKPPVSKRWENILARQNQNGAGSVL